MKTILFLFLATMLACSGPKADTQAEPQTEAQKPKPEPSTAREEAAETEFKEVFPQDLPFRDGQRSFFYLIENGVRKELQIQGVNAEVMEPYMNVAVGVEGNMNLQINNMEWALKKKDRPIRYEMVWMDFKSAPYRINNYDSLTCITNWSDTNQGTDRTVSLDIRGKLVKGQDTLEFDVFLYNLKTIRSEFIPE